MFKINTARFLSRFIVLGAAVGTLGGYSSYAMRQSGGHPASVSAAQALEFQIPNRDAKTDRLARVAALTPATLTDDQQATYSLASIAPNTEFDHMPAPASALRTEPAAKQQAAAVWPEIKATAEPKVDAKPERKFVGVPPTAPDNATRLPPPPPAQSGVLDDTQIAGLKTRLHLTAEQIEYWPAVESALRDVVRTQMRNGHVRHARGGKATIDTNSPEVQKLIWAAMPLLMRLRDDQKHEVRKLARVIGLDSVASQI